VRRRARRVVPWLALASVLALVGAIALALGDAADDPCPPPADLRSARYERPIFECSTTDRDVIYARVGRESLRLDIHQPMPDSARRRPAIVMVHGGGHFTGDKSDLESAARHYARLGYVVVSANYRLDRSLGSTVDSATPSGNGERLERIVDAFYRSVADTRRAVTFLRLHASEYRINPERIAIMGWSAGGSTSLGHALERGDPTPGPPQLQADVAAVVAASGFLAGPPLNQIVDQPPPALLIGYERDTANAPPVEPVCQALAAQGGACTVESIPGAGHFVDFVEMAPVVLPFLQAHLVDGAS
jgi:acetyl esterase/lipase